MSTIGDSLLTRISSTHYDPMFSFPLGCIFIILRMHHSTLEPRLERTSVFVTSIYKEQDIPCLHIPENSVFESLYR